MRSTFIKKVAGNLFRPIYGGLGHILVFHRVCPSDEIQVVPGLSRLEISIEKFTEIVTYLTQHNYHFVSLDQMVESLLSNNLQSKTICITFDDGYVDNLTVVLPLLEPRKIPFSIFITTDNPDRRSILWWYFLQDAVIQKKCLQFSSHGKEYRCDFSDPMTGTSEVKLIKGLLKNIPPAQNLDEMSHTFNLNKEELLQKTKELTLSWEQVIALSKNPLVQIGAHCVHHFPLGQLTDAQAVSEILQSKTILESRIGKPIHHFAYPYGYAGKREVSLVQGAGYTTAVTTKVANIFPEHARNLHALPRLDLTLLENTDELPLWLNGYYPARVNRMKRIITT